MRRILFIVNVDWFFVSHRLPIALQALKQGYEVHVACTVTDKRELLESLGLRVHHVQLSRSGASLIREPQAIFRLYRIIRNVAPDLCHAITIKPVIYAGILSRIAKVPSRVASIPGLGYLFITNELRARCLRRMIRPFYRLALKDCDAVVFQNQVDYQTLLGMQAISPSQAEFIRGSGVDLAAYPVEEEAPGAPCVMLLGRLLKFKGVHEFVAAGRIVRREFPDVRIVIVGNSDEDNPHAVERSALNHWCEQGDIEYWGFRHDVPQVLALAHLVVLPSYGEGLPKCLIEAAACGRAVVTTDVQGCREAIEEGVTGVLVPVRNVEALAKAIIELLNNPERRKAMGQEGRKLAEKAFDISEVVARHMAIYRAAGLQLSAQKGKAFDG